MSWNFVPEKEKRKRYAKESSIKHTRSILRIRGGSFSESKATGPSLFPVVDLFSREPEENLRQRLWEVTNSCDRMTGNFYEIVSTVSSSDEQKVIHNWWTKNLLEFNTELMEIYATLIFNNPACDELFASTHLAPEIGYPVVYKWKSKVLPLPRYIEAVFNTCDDKLCDPSRFPTLSQIELEEIGESVSVPYEYPLSFYREVSDVFTDLFRVLHIIYSNHCFLLNPENKHHLDLFFRHFLYFGWYWDLLNVWETAVMKVEVPAIREQFLQDLVSNLSK